MVLNLAPETGAKLNELAQRTRRGIDDLLTEAVENLVQYNQWFEQKVNASIAAAARGEVASDEEVLAWIEKRERP